MDVSIVVATYGDPSWVALARRRAIPSAEKFGVPVVHVHGDTLHGARNACVAKVRTEWVVHLDADDELEDGYLDHMFTSDADVKVPSVRYVTSGFNPVRMPKVAGHQHDCTADCLPFGNWIVVGAAVRAQQVRDVGGWRDFPWSEDWDLWVRCWHAGATIEAVPDAVYRAHVRPNSRNRSPNRSTRLAAHQAIARANDLPVPA